MRYTSGPPNDRPGNGGQPPREWPDPIAALIAEGVLEHVGWQSQRHTPGMIGCGVHKHFFDTWSDDIVAHHVNCNPVFVRKGSVVPVMKHAEQAVRKASAALYDAFTCEGCGGHNWLPNDDLTLRCANCGWENPQAIGKPPHVDPGPLSKGQGI